MSDGAAKTSKNTRLKNLLKGLIAHDYERLSRQELGGELAAMRPELTWLRDLFVDLERRELPELPRPVSIAAQQVLDELQKLFERIQALSHQTEGNRFIAAHGQVANDLGRLIMQVWEKVAPLLAYGYASEDHAGAFVRTNEAETKKRTGEFEQIVQDVASQKSETSD